MTDTIQPFLLTALAKGANRPEAEISLDHKLVDDLKLDSLDIVQVTIDIEDATNKLVNDDDVALCVTVRDLVRLVERVGGGRQS